jgi:hypothetical protein
MRVALPCLPRRQFGLLQRSSVPSSLDAARNVTPDLRPAVRQGPGRNEPLVQRNHDPLGPDVCRPSTNKIVSATRSATAWPATRLTGSPVRRVLIRWARVKAVNLCALHRRAHPRRSRRDRLQGYPIRSGAELDAIDAIPELLAVGTAVAEMRVKQDPKPGFRRFCCCGRSTGVSCGIRPITGKRNVVHPPRLCHHAVRSEAGAEWHRN